MSARIGFIQVVLIGVAVLVLGPAVRGDVLYVNGTCGDDGWSGLDPNCAASDGPKATIQAAINAAGVDDTIIVAPYRYYENINLKGKQIVLRSTDPQDPNVVAATVIDGGGVGDAVQLDGTETTETLLSGFTITNGGSLAIGYGIAGESSHASITYCIVRGNRSAGLVDCDGPIARCTITGNRGAGLVCCDGSISDCTIAGNGANGLAGCNGLIARCIVNGNTGYGLYDCDGTISGCVVTGTCLSRGLAIGIEACDGVITDCVVSGNYVRGFSSCDGAISNCTVRGNGAGVRDSWDSYELWKCAGPISNCVIWASDSALDGYGGGVIGPGCSVPTYSCIRNWAGAGEGNIIADPGLADVNLRIAQPMARGYWSQDGVYDPSMQQVGCFDAGRQSWAPNELVGKLLKPDVTQRREFVITRNTENVIWVWADYDTIHAGASWVTEGARYAIYDYHLQPDSPCINRGDPNAEYGSLTDIDGDDRVVHGRVDIGADEYTGPLMPRRPALVMAEPLPNSTLPKTANNVLWLTFDMPIELPGGSPLSIVDLHEGICVGETFLYSLEADGYTLKAQECGSALINRTWYRVAPTLPLDVHLFTLDVCTLFGDADQLVRSHRGPSVDGDDYSVVKEHLGERTDARYDLNGSGRVTAADYSVVKAHRDERVPDKP